MIRELLYVSFTTLSLVCLRHGCIGATKTWRCGRCGCSHKSIRGSIQQGQTTWQSHNCTALVAGPDFKLVSQNHKPPLTPPPKVLSLSNNQQNSLSASER